MGSLRRILALAAFESRLNLRLIRGWILGGLVTILAVAVTAYYLALHRWGSGFTAIGGFATKDFGLFEGAFNAGVFLGLVGIFYAFDWRHRDQSAHFAATLDAAPLTRLEQAWGKFLGLTPLILVPMLIVFVVTVGLAVGFGLGLTAWTYVVMFLGYGLPFALTPLAMSFGVAGLIRNQALARVVAIVAPLLLLAVMFGAAFTLPERVAVVAGALVDFPLHSDLVGYVATPVTILQRVANLIEIVLFVSLAALGPLGLPRDARERTGRLAFIGALAALLVIVLVGTHFAYVRTDAARHAVLDAEERALAKAGGVATLRRDIQADITSSRQLQGSIRLRLRRTGSAWPAEVPFRLNAGLTLRSATVAGTPAAWTREASVVMLALPPGLAGDEAELEMAWDGRPTWPSVDAGRALADLEMSAQVRTGRRIFGTVPLFYERRCTVLGLDAGWYPDTALLLGARFPALARHDIAPGSLTVSLPEGMRAASVGRREATPGRMTFTSDVPVPGFALVAGRYEERSAEVDGIVFRVLYHRAHRRNVELLAKAKDALHARIHERLAEIRARTGLAYPHPELTLVAVPQQLDNHSSGWDSANRMGPPGLVLGRESHLFRARFEQALEARRRNFRREGGSSSTSAAAGASAPAGASAAAEPPASASAFDEAKGIVDVVQSFCATDFTGGNPERLALASCWDHRVRPQGEGAALLAMALPAFVVEIALGRYVPDTPEVARAFATGALQASIGAVVQGEGERVGDIIMNGIADQDLVWAMLQEKRFDEMEPTTKPAEFAGAIYVRGRQPLLAVRDSIGAERTAQALASLVADPAEPTLTFARLRDAFVAAAGEEHAEAVAQQLDALLSGTALPGYVVTRKPESWRLPGETEAWQVLFVVHNRGTADGTARIQIGEGDAAIAREVQVPAGGGTEVGIVVPRKPETWRLLPYLALNRRAPTGSFDVLEQAPAEPAPDGARPASPPARPELIVDNVDPGFSVVVEETPTAWTATDEKGKRVLGDVTFLWLAPSKWKRWRPGELSRMRPFGHFDETAAIKKGADGTSPATWSVALPEPGRWRVAAFLPSREARGEGARFSPKFTFVVKQAAGEKEVELALDAGTPGWNDLGSFEFAGPAEVRLLDRGKGLVVADAVRFTKE